MFPDLERLIQLQQLDNAASDATRVVEAIPSRIEALDVQLTAGAASWISVIACFSAVVGLLWGNWMRRVRR